MSDVSSTSTYDPNECQVVMESDTDTDATYDPTDQDNNGKGHDNYHGKGDVHNSGKMPPNLADNRNVSQLRKTQSKMHEISDSDSDSTCGNENHSEKVNIETPCTTISKGEVLLSAHHDISDDDTDSCGKNEKILSKCHGDKSLQRSATIELSEAGENSTMRKPPCKYGLDCYRKNPSHFVEFSHPNDMKRKHESVDESSSSQPKKRKVERASSSAGTSSSTETKTHNSLVGKGIVEDALPYCFLLTKVTGIKAVHNQTGAMSLKDILHPSMGKQQKSAQFNYMFEIPWIMQQYPAQFRSCPLLIVHGFERSNKAALDMEAAAFGNIRTCQAKLDIMYGTHHSKMMLLLYDTGLRVVITTANLIERDWYQKTQGVWVSPVFPKMSKASLDGDSATHFKHDLVQYLTAYRARQLNEWIEIIKQHDMSQAKVYLIGSVPGRHTGEQKKAYGHLKLRQILDKFGPSTDSVKNWPIVGQFSSIGSLGPNDQSWMCGEWYTSLSAARGGGTSLGGNTNKLKLIYPSKDNVRLSLEGYPAGGSLPYSINTAKKQTYLNSYLHQWRSEIHGRSRASPHIKTYCRVSPDHSHMAWFLVTSANLSKAAWGALEKKGAQLMIRSYEIGVLFLPQHFGNKADSFLVQHKNESKSSKSKNLPVFPQPYDLPPTPYTKSDHPWIVDIPYTDKPDSHGNAWCPE